MAIDNLHVAVPGLIAGLALAVVGLVPSRADACGGFFCDGGPQPMPVDQSGEDILFIADADSVEVHIRIQYEGNPENFAWVVPLQSEPTSFGVGSEILFDNIKLASVPRYGITTQFDSCGDGGLPFPPSASGGDGDGGSAGGLGENDDSGGPTILAQETVGAFEITILSGGTASELIDWLDAYGYLQDPEAEPIFEEYLAEEHLFAAIKLNGGAGVEELHPIVFGFDHTEPCVPLRLTRIAALDDMDVRTYFLGGARVVPMNYRHVLVNPLQIDWPSQASNYKDVITLAVDAEHADGRAFVTEYAGPSDIVSTSGLFSELWNAQAFAEATAVEAIGELRSQGLWYCDEFGDFITPDGSACFSDHPLVGGLVEEFLPVPTGVDPYDFYTEPERFVGVVDEEAWDAGMFSSLVAERVVEPGRHATELLANNPYLTRMYTTISPAEMTADPMFHANADLEEVPALRTAVDRRLCSGDSVWILPDGREVFVPLGESWPEITAFYEERVEETPDFGAPVNLADRGDEIDTALDEYNALQGWDPPREEGGGDGLGADAGESGCACRSTVPAERGALGMLVFVALLGALRRRDSDLA